MLGENCILINLWLNISFFSLFSYLSIISRGGTPENSRWGCPGSPNPDPLIKNKTLTAVINFVSFRNFITWRFVCYFNVHFQKWSEVSPLKIMTRLYYKQTKTRPLSPGGGTPHMKGVGMRRRKFWIKPLKETDLGVAQTFFLTLLKRDHVKTQTNEKTGLYE